MELSLLTGNINNYIELLMVYKKIVTMLYCCVIGFWGSLFCSKTQLDKYDDDALKKSRLTSLIRQVIDEKMIACKSCNRELSVEAAVIFFYRDHAKEVHSGKNCFLCTEEIETLKQDPEKFFEKFSLHPFCYEKFCGKLDKIVCSTCYLNSEYDNNIAKKKSCCDSFSAHCKNCCAGTGACMAGCLSAFWTCLCSDVFCGIFTSCCECLGSIFEAADE